MNLGSAWVSAFKASLSCIVHTVSKESDELKSEVAPLLVSFREQVYKQD